MWQGGLQSTHVSGKGETATLTMQTYRWGLCLFLPAEERDGYPLHRKEGLLQRSGLNLIELDYEKQHAWNPNEEPHQESRGWGAQNRLVLEPARLGGKEH